MTNEITVMLADDDELTRTMLSALIDHEEGLRLAGMARDTDEAIRLAETATPDVALLDLDMPGGGGYKASEEIKGRSPRTQVIALTALDSPETQFEVMRAGAVSFLVKGTPNEEIAAAIRSAVRWRSAEHAAPVPADSHADDVEQRVAALEARVAALERMAVRRLGAGDE